MLLDGVISVVSLAHVDAAVIDLRVGDQESTQVLRDTTGEFSVQLKPARRNGGLKGNKLILNVSQFLYSLLTLEII